MKREGIKLPVKVGYLSHAGWCVLDKDARIVCRYATQEDANQIVTIVNSYERMRTALEEIIAECPKPKLPYGQRVVEIATTALAQEQR